MHAVFSVHVCNSFIHCITCCITVWLFIPPFIFNFSFWVYTNCIHNYVHCISLEYYISLGYDILAHVARIFDISTSIHQVYTAYCWNSNIFITGLISCGWYSSVITAWSYPNVYPFCCIYTLYTVYTLHVLPLSHWFHVYEMYTSGIFTDTLYGANRKPIFPIILSYHSDIHIPPGVQLVAYTTCIHLVSSSKAVYTTIIHLRFLKRKYFSYCHSRLRMLACG